MSITDASALIKKMNVKKHRNAGYFFELDDVEDQRAVWNNPDRTIYRDYKYGTPLVRLRIFYEKPDETPLPNKGSIPNRITRK